MTRNKLTAILTKCIGDAVDGLLIGQGYQILDFGALCVNARKQNGVFDAHITIDVRDNTPDGVGVKTLALNVDVVIDSDAVKELSADLKLADVSVDFNQSVFCNDLTNSINGSLA